MARWTKKRLAQLQSTIESIHIAASHASNIALAVWQEWDNNPKLTQEERDSLIDSLTDAKIQIETAIEMLEK